MPAVFSPAKEAKGSGEIAVVYEESVRLVFRLTVLPESGGDCLRLLSGIAEDKALMASRVLKYVSESGISCCGCLVFVFLCIPGGACFNLLFLFF